MKKNTRRIGWLTCEAKRDFVASDLPLIECLRRDFNTEAVPIVWTEASELPSGIDWVWVRTPWDYWRNLTGFLNWLEMAQKKVPVRHSARLVAWNADKNYLLDLEKKGIAIPPSLLIEDIDLAAIIKKIQASGWEESVLKPTVSAGAENTFRLSRADLEKKSDAIVKARAQSPLLLQKFLPSVATHGEASLMYFRSPGGSSFFTHAVLKKTAQGDFRVQEKFGGGLHSYQPPKAQFDFAEKALSCVEQEWLYARVDLLFSDQEIWLGELEMIEPELFFHHASSNALKQVSELVVSL